jgi:hypothetical protein
MIAVHFSKAFAEHFLDAVQKGQPIAPPDAGWTGNHMLTLAGMLYAAVFSQGPHAFQVTKGGQNKLMTLPEEHREAVEETFKQDIHDAIEFLSNLAFQVFDGQYDELCEADVSGVVYRGGHGRKSFRPVKGFKAQTEGK